MRSRKADARFRAGDKQTGAGDASRAAGNAKKVRAIMSRTFFVSQSRWFLRIGQVIELIKKDSSFFIPRIK